MVAIYNETTSCFVYWIDPSNVDCRLLSIYSRAAIVSTVIVVPSRLHVYITETSALICVVQAWHLSKSLTASSYQTGITRDRSFPEFEGRDVFRGIQMHSQDLHDEHVFKDKHVVVVGLGSSSIDVTDVVSRTAKKVNYY